MLNIESFSKHSILICALFLSCSIFITFSNQPSYPYLNKYAIIQHTHFIICYFISGKCTINVNLLKSKKSGLYKPPAQHITSKILFIVASCHFSNRIYAKYLDKPLLFLYSVEFLRCSHWEIYLFGHNLSHLLLEMLADWKREHFYPKMSFKSKRNVNLLRDIFSFRTSAALRSISQVGMLMCFFKKMLIKQKFYFIFLWCNILFMQRAVLEHHGTCTFLSRLYMGNTLFRYLQHCSSATTLVFACTCIQTSDLFDLFPYAYVFLVNEWHFILCNNGGVAYFITVLFLTYYYYYD